MFFQVCIKGFESFFFVLDLLENFARQPLIQKPIPYFHEIHQRRVLAWVDIHLGKHCSYTIEHAFQVHIDHAVPLRVLF